MTKILHIITGLNVGGAERFLHVLLAGGLATHCENRVISLSDMGEYGPRLEALGVRVTCLGMRSGRPSIQAIRVLRRSLKEFQPDIIQGWMYHGNLVASLAATVFRGKPLVVWNVRHSLYDLGAEKRGTQGVIRLCKWISRQPENILYNSHVSRQQHQSFGFHSANGVVIPNGFDTTQWKPDSEARQHTRKMLGLRDHDLLVGFVARYHPMKDVPTFLQAMEELMQEDQRVHCVMVGRNIGPENAALAPYFSKLPMDRIHILGQRDDIPRLMAGFDVFCLSSNSEAFPNVLGEAMACGVPCVSTEVGDSGHVLGDTGQIVPASNPRALAGALKTFLAFDVLTRQTMGSVARRRILESFSLPEITQRYINLYTSLMDAKN